MTSSLYDSRKIQAFLPNEHSFYDDLVTMVMSLSSYMFTLHCAISSNNPKELKERPLQEWISYIRPLKDPEHPFALSSRALGQSVVFFPFWVISQVSLNGWPQFLEYRFERNDRGSLQARVDSLGNQKIMSRIIGSSFLSYYESQQHKIRDIFGSDADDWPDTVNFARHTRNGFAHGGEYYIANSNAQTVHWRDWTLSHSSSGRQVLFGDDGLGSGDVVWLMKDLDELL